MRLAALAATFVALTGVTAACSSDESSTRGGSGGSAGSAGKGGASSGGAGGGAGGTSGTAGAAGAGKAGAGGSGGTSSSAGGEGGAAGADPCANAIVCEDFEAQPLGAEPGAPWTANTDDNGEAVVSSDKAYGGARALRLRTSGASSYQRAYVVLEGAPLFPAAKDVIWGRLMVYTEAAANDGVHWTMIQGEGDVAGQPYRSLIRYGGQHMQRLMANYETNSDTAGYGSDCWHHSETKMPEGSWACIEWRFDAPSDTMNFYLDGSQVGDLTVVGMNDPSNGDGCVTNDLNGVWTFPVFDKLSLGWESYQTDDPREIWIDDVAIGTERLGCP